MTIFDVTSVMVDEISVYGVVFDLSPQLLDRDILLQLFHSYYLLAGLYTIIRGQNVS